MSYEAWKRCLERMAANLGHEPELKPGRFNWRATARVPPAKQAKVLDCGDFYIAEMWVYCSDIINWRIYPTPELGLDADEGVAERDPTWPGCDASWEAARAAVDTKVRDAVLDARPELGPQVDELQRDGEIFTAQAARMVETFWADVAAGRRPPP